MKPIKKSLQVSTFLVFYLILSVQIGIGVLNFQPTIVQSAGYDAWISVLLAGGFVHVIIWMEYKMLNKNKNDLIDIHKETFGKWLGGFFSVLVCLYFVFLAVVIVRAYIEVIQTWIFPELTTWGFSLAILPLVYYVVAGGFRTVAGIAFMGLIFPAYLILPFLFPIEFSDFHQLLPIFNHSIFDILKAAKEMTLSYLGFSTLLFFYPFVKDAEKSQKWAHLAVIITTLIYLFIALISFAYYSQKQLMNTLWATLGLWKIVKMPFVERFEYIGVSSWLIVVLPNVCMVLWAASRGFKQLFKITQKTVLKLSLVFIFIISINLKDRIMISAYSKMASEAGFYFISIYIPFLFCAYTIKSKWRERK